MTRIDSYMRGKGGGSSMFRALMKGKKSYGSSWLPKRRSRHIKSQMKFFGSGKFMDSFLKGAWKLVSKRKSYEK